MTAYHIIAKKRDGQTLTPDEIDYFIKGFSQEKIPDYQMAALLMAIYLNGFSFEETAVLTRVMLESGIRMNFAKIPGAKIDKHSTGGVGDKVSLILAPLVAAAGVKVPMISGRGLSHSGGTLDKLEAIPGFRTNLSASEFYRQIEEIGVSMIGQTQHICPADKKMYALRDTTATIESIPLITGSILSKKLAEGINGLVLDVKTGTGAFMKSEQQARALAESLVQTAALNELPTRAIITRMDEPLGYAAGNWLETKEAITCLQGRGPQDVMEVTLVLSAHMLLMAGIATSEADALGKLNELIDSGKAFEKFVQIVEKQGGNIAYLYEPESYPVSKIEEKIYSPVSGTISDINALTIGLAVVQLGGGRLVMEDQIDYKAGIVLHAKVGDRAQKGDVLATLYTDRTHRVEEISRAVQDAFVVQDKSFDKKALIIDVLF